MPKKEKKRKRYRFQVGQCQSCQGRVVYLGFITLKLINARKAIRVQVLGSYTSSYKLPILPIATNGTFSTAAQQKLLTVVI